MNPETLRTLDLGRPLGVPLRVHVPGVVILTATNAAAGLLLCRVARPEWSLGIGLVAAVAIALLLLLSAVAHEYAHLLVALRTGRPVGALQEVDLAHGLAGRHGGAKFDHVFVQPALRSETVVVAIQRLHPARRRPA